MANYFDFHFHPMFKQFISHYEEDYPSKREAKDLTSDIKPSHVVMQVFDETALHILASQCSVDQIKKGSNFLGIASIVSLEHGIASGKSLAGKLLRSELSAPLDPKYFDNVINGNTSYFRLFMKELNLYSILANTGSSKKAGAALATILTRKNNNVNLDNISTPTFAIAIEGGHNLNRSLITKDPSQAANLDKPAPGNHDNVYKDFFDNANTVLSPAESLQKLFAAMWKEDMDLFYLTLTHLTYIEELPLASHAFGMKMLKHKNFYPSGFGITKAGKEVIDAAYKMTADGKSTPVLIDLKHMSLKSRLDMYRYHAEKNYTVPVIATHMGVTGYTISEWINQTTATSATNEQPVEIKSKVTTVAMENSNDEQGATNYHFNPWSINLMDEDIIHILNTNGMIGISLDRRILGYENNTKGNGVQDNIDAVLDNREYMSADEYRYFFTEHMPDMPGAYDKNAIVKEKARNADVDVIVDKKGTLNDKQKDELREIANIALTILHIVAVGINKTNTDPWKHIMIGSDYDGLIDPINYSISCEHLEDVEARLLPIIQDAETSYLHYHRYKYPKNILPADKDGIYDSAAIAAKLRDIMYNNGKDFLKEWYNGQL